MSFQQYNVNTNLTSVDLASTANVTGSYYNGSLNNGVGATITFPSGPFVVDQGVVTAGMSVLLKDQTSANQNGIYFCTQTGDNTTEAILTRRQDFQSIEQLKGGQFLSVADGHDNKGSMYTLIEPLPENFGIDEITFLASISRDISVELDTATPGIVSGLNVSISDSVAVDDLGANLTALRGAIYLNGVTNDAEINCVQGLMQSQGGGYGPSARAMSCVSSIIDFTISGSTINGAEVNGFFSKYNGTSVATDLSQVNMFKSFNDTLQSVGCHYYMWGPADYAFQLQGVTGNYYVMTGTSVGSPGDPTHCNAPRAIKILSNNTEVGYIPVFLQNT